MISPIFPERTGGFDSTSASDFDLSLDKRGDVTARLKVHTTTLDYNGVEEIKAYGFLLPTAEKNHCAALLNVYPMSPASLAVADYTWEINNHAMLHAAYRDFTGSDFSFREHNKPPYVSGSMHARDIYLRIDAPEPKYNSKGELTYLSFRALQDYIKLFARSLKIAEKFSAQQEGEVYIEPVQQSKCGSMMTAEALGILHRMLPAENFSLVNCEKFVKSCYMSSTPVPHYYARGVGTRYVTPGQLASLHSLTPDRESFLNALAYLKVNMDSKKISRTAGVREMQFLVQKGEKGSSTRYNLQQKLYSDLVELKQFASTFPEVRWNKNKEFIVNKLDCLICNLVDSNPKEFASDDFSNPIYVKKISEILRGENTSTSREELGVQFSTPLIALPVGTFDPTQLTQERPFNFETRDPQLIAITNEVIRRSKKDGLLIDSVSVWKPLSPLTSEERSTNFRVNFGTPRDESFVVTVKSFNKSNSYTEVWRRHPYSKDYWDNIRNGLIEKASQKPQFKIYKQLTPTELSGLVDAFLKAQQDLYNQLSNSLPDRFAYSIPAFETAKINIDGQPKLYQHRPFVYGERFDFEHFSAMRSDNLLQITNCFASVAAVNFLAQRPLLNPQDMLIDRRDSDSAAQRIVSLGISDAFSGLIHSVNTKQFTVLSSRLYGSYLAAFRAHLEHGIQYIETGEIDDSLWEKVFKPTFKNAFVESFDSIVTKGKLNFDRVKDYYAEHSFYLESVPAEFAISNISKFSNKLMTLPAEWIADSMLASADQFKNFYDSILPLCQLSIDTSRELDFRDQVIFDIRKLISHHYFDPKRFRKVKSSLSKSSSLNPLNPYQIEEALFVANVLLEVQSLIGPRVSKFVAETKEQQSPDAFIESLNENFGPHLLSKETANEFYMSYNHLSNFLNSSEGEQQQAVKSFLHGFLPIKDFR